MTTRNNRPSDEDISPLEKETLRALRLSGDLAPEQADEVAAVEKSWEEITEDDLPNSLLDADALAVTIVQGQQDNVLEFHPEKDEMVDVVDQLARAARFGKTITDKIEQRMTEDKRRARKIHD